jgi:hypothetical protein
MQGILTSTHVCSRWIRLAKDRGFTCETPARSQIQINSWVAFHLQLVLAEIPCAGLQ